ncbi:MAG: hypothetical protein PWP46_2009 [Fusobacteriaceae bacterium]|jgi:sulfite reductase (ferredoxin)|nr:sir [Fusobacteriales bacterium]MDN5305123.1 hypothetical protein [Fusobacteriaceae bacterium]
MFKVPVSLNEDIKKYELHVNDFINEKISKKDFKPFAAESGVYWERDGINYMIRPRIPSGIISLFSLKKIVELAKKYNGSRLHFTTRQDIQFHGIKLENTIKIVKELKEYEIYTRGTGGNTARNITIPPLTGLIENEKFDVAPYALVATEFLIQDSTNYSLPRKYKIGFSSTDEDIAHVKISDLGFLAKIKNNKKGFVVYGAGGLGAVARPAIILKDFISENEVIYYVQAMKRVFDKYGDRTNKSKARIRFILERLGEEEFKKIFFEELENVKKEINIENINISKFNKINYFINGEKNSRKQDVIKSKYKNRYILHIKPENGNVEPKKFYEFLLKLEKIDKNLEFRLSLNQDFYIVGIDGKDVNKILELKKNYFKEPKSNNIKACTGATTCQLGICSSQGLLGNILQTLNKEEVKYLPEINISGCPNSCAQHQIAELGFSGRKIRVNDNVVPAYSVYINGNVKNKIAEFGEEIGILPAKKIIDFLRYVAKLRQNDNSEISKFYKKNKSKLIDKIAEINLEIKNNFNKDLSIDY